MMPAYPRIRSLDQRPCHRSLFFATGKGFRSFLPVMGSVESRSDANLRQSVNGYPTIQLIGICFFAPRVLNAARVTAACLVSLWVTLCLVREHSASLWNCVFCHWTYNAAVLRQWALCGVGMIVFLLLCRGRVLQFLGVGSTESGDHES